MKEHGWWADKELGSELWTLTEYSRSDELLSRVNEICKEALKWMIDDGVADIIDVSSSFSEDGTLRIEVQIIKDIKEALNFKYSYNWKAQISGRL